MTGIISSVLTIYIWAIICVLIYFLYAIARFYQEKSGQQTYRFSYLVAIALFGAAALKDAWSMVGLTSDMWGSLLRLIAGLVLTGAGFYLFNLMVGRKK